MSLHVVAASAGTGKTHRITEEVLKALCGGPPVPVNALMAVTYTNRARDELVSRLRRHLGAIGRAELAQQLPEALLGTVHSVCLRLLSELSLEAGLPAQLRVLSGDPVQALAEAVEDSLPPALRDRMEQLGRRCRLFWSAPKHRAHWLIPVTEVMTLARQNRIGPQRLAEMGSRSWEGLCAHLPPPAERPECLEAEFGDALEKAISGLESVAPVKDTLTVLSELRGLRQELEDRPEELPWSSWVAAGRRQPGAAGRPFVAPLAPFGRRVLGHPGLHADLQGLIESVYEAARVGLQAFEDWKRERSLVDYDDMIELTLRLLESSTDARQELAARTRLIVVDEFQDTTPLQLALFLQLHRGGGRSVWVGDRKQCIFEYAGADPQLLEAVTRWHAQSGGQVHTLDANRRSRPGLVEPISRLFEKALASCGVSPEEVRVHPVREEPPALPAPWAIWRIDRHQKGAEDVAAGVVRLLRSAAAVSDRNAGGVRPVRAGDVGILVRTNAEGVRIAEALGRAGMAASASRPGLLETAEGVAVDAAVQWLVNPTDRLSAAVLDALFEFGGEDPDAWLTKVLERAHTTAAWREPLEALRRDLPELGTVDVLDRILLALDLPDWCARWPDAGQRRANLDALRAVVRGHAEAAAQRGEPATLSGLVRHFGELRTPRFLRDGRELVDRGADEQHAPRDGVADAVTVITYHRAKGLEWPVVLLTGLDDEVRAPVFDVQLESDRSELDPAAPLEGRWIRWWPSPSGADDEAPMRERVEPTEEGRAVLEQERQQRLRLLYVGFTRARDRVILVTRYKDGRPQTRWLDELKGPQGEALVRLPAEGEEGRVTLGLSDLEVEAELWRPAASAAEGEKPEAMGWPRPEHRPTFEPYLLRPSDGDEEVEYRTAEPIALGCGLGARYERGDETWNAVGDAVHHFFASESPGEPPEARLSRAQRLLEFHAATERVDPARLVAEADAFEVFLAERWAGAKVRREVPISAAVEGGRRIHGLIDLLLELPGRKVVIDHKTFPGETPAAWRSAAKSHAPQLALYAVALQTLYPGDEVELWIHLPVPGAMIRLHPVRGGATGGTK